MARPTRPPRAAAAVIGRICGARMDDGELGVVVGFREEFDKDAVLSDRGRIAPPGSLTPSTQDRRRYAGGIAAGQLPVTDAGRLSHRNMTSMWPIRNPPVQRNTSSHLRNIIEIIREEKSMMIAANLVSMVFGHLMWSSI